MLALKQHEHNKNHFIAAAETGFGLQVKDFITDTSVRLRAGGLPAGPMGRCQVGTRPEGWMVVHSD